MDRWRQKQYPASPLCWYTG